MAVTYMDSCAHSWLLMVGNAYIISLSTWGHTYYIPLNIFLQTIIIKWPVLLRGYFELHSFNYLAVTCLKTSNITNIFLERIWIVNIVFNVSVLFFVSLFSVHHCQICSWLHRIGRIRIFGRCNSRTELELRFAYIHSKTWIDMSQENSLSVNTMGICCIIIDCLHVTRLPVSYQLHCTGDLWPGNDFRCPGH